MAVDRFAVGETGCSCTCGSACSQTFTTNTCSSQTLGGAAVSVYASSGGALLASGTTATSGGSLGKVTLSWSGTGSVYVTASCSVFSYASSLTLTCGGNKTLALLNPIYVTDGNGSLELVWNGSSWATSPNTCLSGGSYQTVTYQGSLLGCVLGSASPVPYTYYARCFTDPATSKPAFEVYRSWSATEPVATVYYGTSCPTDACLVALCQSSIFFDFVSISCSTPTLSGTPVAAGSNIIGDPAAGAITVSA